MRQCQCPSYSHTGKRLEILHSDDLQCHCQTLALDTSHFIRDRPSPSLCWPLPCPNPASARSQFEHCLKCFPKSPPAAIADVTDAFGARYRRNRPGLPDPLWLRLLLHRACVADGEGRRTRRPPQSHEERMVMSRLDFYSLLFLLVFMPSASACISLTIGLLLSSFLLLQDFSSMLL